MSLPPQVRWEYGYVPEPGSDDARLPTTRARATGSRNLVSALKRFDQVSIWGTIRFNPNL
jgi:hypothetical protein